MKRYSAHGYLKYMLNAESKKVELIRFLMTGSVAVIIQYGLYLIFVSFLNIGPIVSTIFSYGISFIVNFFLSNYFTFHSRPSIKNLLSFAGSHVINMVLQTILVAVFSHYFNAQIALLPAMIICVPCNFLFVRFALKSKWFQR